eukprot:SAG22_NODE_13_length_33548_cov_57.167773_1_plen_234_part_00
MWYGANDDVKQLLICMHGIACSGHGPRPAPPRRRRRRARRRPRRIAGIDSDGSDSARWQCARRDGPAAPPLARRRAERTKLLGQRRSPVAMVRMLQSPWLAAAAATVLLSPCLVQLAGAVGPGAAAAASTTSTSCSPRPCPSHASRTWCPSDPAPDQCDKPSVAKCPAGPCPAEPAIGKPPTDGPLRPYPIPSSCQFVQPSEAGSESPRRTGLPSRCRSDSLFASRILLNFAT